VKQQLGIAARSILVAPLDVQQLKSFQLQGGFNAKPVSYRRGDYVHGAESALSISGRHRYCLNNSLQLCQIIRFLQPARVKLREAVAE